MERTRAYGLVLIVACLIVSDAGIAAAATVDVFQDDFNRADSSTIGNNWVKVFAGDNGARILTNRLQLTNDFSGAANSVGQVYVHQAFSNFSSPFTGTLSSNPGLVTWSFNMQQIRTDPSGFDSGNYGVAFILAASSSDMLTNSGYAVVLGQSGSDDRVRLAHYTGGLDANINVTSIITGGTDFGTTHLSIIVTYDPSTNTWELFSRDDGGSFADPLSGLLTSQGNVVNTTYTNTSLTHMAAFWNHNTAANQTSFVDNVTVQVFEPETVVPAPAALPAGLALLALVGVRRRR